MSKVKGTISRELRSKHEVNEFFYPKIAMDLDLPDGLDGEISGIMKLLQKNGLQVTTENVLQVMKLKRELILRYAKSSGGKTVLEKYNDLLLKYACMHASILKYRARVENH